MSLNKKSNHRGFKGRTWVALGAMVFAGQSVHAIMDVTKQMHPGWTGTIIHPPSFNAHVSGIDFTKNGDMLISSCCIGPGDSEDGVYRLTGVTGNDANAVVVKKIGGGFRHLHGVKGVGDDIYAVDAARIVKLVDSNGDGVYETLQTICPFPWGELNFEYTFGLEYLNGKLYITTAVGVENSGWPTPQKVKDRGALLEIDIATGTYTVVAGGLRAANGIGLGPDNGIFVTDNQGGWLPSSKLIHVQKGRHYGYMVEPADKTNFQDKPTSPPVVWMPHNDIGRSPTQPAYVKTGLYAGQWLIGDMAQGGIKRVFMEKVAGEWQGVIMPFTGDLEGGPNRITIGPKGELYVGMTGRTDIGVLLPDGSVGETGLQRLDPNGKVTAEILAVRSRAKGMEVEFTMPVNAAAAQASNWTVDRWTYKPTKEYGGPKTDVVKLTVSSVQVSPDKKKVYLEIGNLKEGYVTHIIANPAIMSQEGGPLWFHETWYTLNTISPSEAFTNTTSISDQNPSRDKSGILALLNGQNRAGISFRLLANATATVELIGIDGSVKKSRLVSDMGEQILPTAGISGVHILRVRQGAHLQTWRVML